jgi:hypothetical protein
VRTLGDGLSVEVDARTDMGRSQPKTDPRHGKVTEATLFTPSQLSLTMEESMIPSLSSAGIGSRFVSQDDVETAKARRDEQWKAAYARLGMEPPPQQQEDFSDGRSLAEVSTASSPPHRVLTLLFLSWCDA